MKQTRYNIKIVSITSSEKSFELVFVGSRRLVYNDVNDIGLYSVREGLAVVKINVGDFSRLKKQLDIKNADEAVGRYATIYHPSIRKGKLFDISLKYFKNESTKHNKV